MLQFDWQPDSSSSTPVEPQFEALSPPSCPFTIEYDPAVLRDINLEVQQSFRALPRGGIEAGGLLIGTADDIRLCIRHHEPIACEHAFGPSFQLSERDRARLAEQLAAQVSDSNPEWQVLGWYHSHTRSALLFTPEDAELHDRYFEEPHQVALVLRPHLDRGTEWAIFYRQPGSGILASASTAISRQFERPSSTVEPVRTQPVVAAAPEPPVAEPPPKSEAAVPRRRRTRDWPVVGTIVGAIFVVCAAATLFIRMNYVSSGRATGDPPGLRLEAGPQNDAVQLTWNTDVLRDATRGRLLVADGEAHSEIQLDRRALEAGKLTYSRHADITRFTLRVERPTGGAIEGSTTFVTSTAPAAPPPIVAETAAPPAEPSVTPPAPVDTATPTFESRPESVAPLPAPKPPAAAEISRALAALRGVSAKPLNPPTASKTEVPGRSVVKRQKSSGRSVKSSRPSRRRTVRKPGD